MPCPVSNTTSHIAPCSAHCAEHARPLEGSARTPDSPGSSRRSGSRRTTRPCSRRRSTWPQRHRSGRPKNAPATMPKLFEPPRNLALLFDPIQGDAAYANWRRHLMSRFSPSWRREGATARAGKECRRLALLFHHDVARLGPEVGVKLPIAATGHQSSGIGGGSSVDNKPLDWRI